MLETAWNAYLALAQVLGTLSIANWVAAWYLRHRSVPKQDVDALAEFLEQPDPKTAMEIVALTTQDAVLGLRLWEAKVWRAVRVELIRRQSSSR